MKDLVSELDTRLAKLLELAADPGLFLLKPILRIQTMARTEINHTEGAIWSRVFDPDQATLSPEAARAILELNFKPEDKARMRELAAKARAGTLTPEEQNAIDTYGRVGSVLSILKSKARRSLKNASNRNGTDR